MVNETPSKCCLLCDWCVGTGGGKWACCNLKARFILGRIVVLSSTDACVYFDDSKHYGAHQPDRERLLKEAGYELKPFEK